MRRALLCINTPSQKKVQTKETGSLKTQTQTPPWTVLRYQKIGPRSRYSFLEIVSVSSLAEQSVPVKLPVNDAFLWFWLWRGRVFGVLSKWAMFVANFWDPGDKWSEKWEFAKTGHTCLQLILVGILVRFPECYEFQGVTYLTRERCTKWTFPAAMAGKSGWKMVEGKKLQLKRFFFAWKKRWHPFLQQRQQSKFLYSIRSQVSDHLRRLRNKKRICLIHNDSAPVCSQDSTEDLRIPEICLRILRAKKHPMGKNHPQNSGNFPGWTKVSAVPGLPRWITYLSRIMTWTLVIWVASSAGISPWMKARHKVHKNTSPQDGGKMNQRFFVGRILNWSIFQKWMVLSNEQNMQ